FFFFSSRRRHTRWPRDWSSDVCSSDLREILIDTLAELINGGVVPRIPSQGSVGASGDLAPLAHLALVLVGEGEATYEGELLPGRSEERRVGKECRARWGAEG